jgi:hypothetical protein
MSTSPPPCFGKSWEANHPECAGGLDAAYRNPRDQSNRRDKCAWFSACATRTVAARVAQHQPSTQQVIPVSHLVRQPMQPQPAQPSPIPQPFQSIVKGVNQAAQSMTQQTMSMQARFTPPPGQPYYGQPSPLMVHPSQASMPWVVPMNYPAPGTQMPSFLTVPEPLGSSLGRMLIATIARSMVKAGCWAMANWVDHIPLTPWQSQPTPSSQANVAHSP